MAETRDLPSRGNYLKVNIVKTIFIIFLLGLIIIAVGMGLFLREQQKIIKELETSIENLKLTTVPLRFMVLSRSDKELSARFRFL